MKHLVALLMIGAVSFGQAPKKALKKNENEPVYFVDSVSVDKSELQKYDPKKISSVTVFKGDKAKELLGEEGKDGIIYVETISFCKKRYWSYFASKSSEYKKEVSAPENDDKVQYILNNKVLTTSFEGDLAAINNTSFKSIKFISKKELIKKYKIDDKDFGFEIVSEQPKEAKK